MNTLNKILIIEKNDDTSKNLPKFLDSLNFKNELDYYIIKDDYSNLKPNMCHSYKLLYDTEDLLEIIAFKSVKGNLNFTDEYNFITTKVLNLEHKSFRDDLVKAVNFVDEINSDMVIIYKLTGKCK